MGGPVVDGPRVRFCTRTEARGRHAASLSNYIILLTLNYRMSVSLPKSSRSTISIFRDHVEHHDWFVCGRVCSAHWLSCLFNLEEAERCRSRMGWA
jgi:hypothetical protein